MTEDIKTLKTYQKKKLKKLIDQFVQSNDLNPLVFVNEKHICCPHCGSSKYIKNGITCNRQRYQCKSDGCGKTFSASTKTAIHKMQKTDHWTDFIYLVLSTPVPPTLEELSSELSISTKTAHIWKHKLFAALNKIEQLYLSGIIEMDEVFLPFCVKGRRGYEKTNEIKEIEWLYKEGKQNSMFLCVHNRKGDFGFFPIKIQQKGQVKATDIKRIVETLNIAQNTIVVTDGSKASTKYFKTRTDIKHEVFISSGQKTSIKHNNNINVTMKLFKDWSNRFNGFSTKYLWNYLNWFRFMRKFNENYLKYAVQNSIKDNEGYTRFEQIPTYYEQYLKAA